MKIQYYAASSTMGDTPESDCNAYREWAKAEIEAEYKDAQVQVLNEENLNVSAWTDEDEHQEEVNEFCSRLWDCCPWNWSEEA
jgi:hypothetical protein